MCIRDSLISRAVAITKSTIPLEQKQVGLPDLVDEFETEISTTQVQVARRINVVLGG